MASCWVMVLPPWTTWPARRLAKAARSRPDGIDAEMAVEAAVLGRDHRLRHIARHFLQVTGWPKRSPKVAISVPSAARIVTLGRRSAGQIAGIGQCQREIAEHAAADDRRPQQQQDDNSDRPSKNYSADAAPPRSALGRRANALRRVCPQPRFSHRRRLGCRVNDRAAASRSRRSCRRCRCGAAPTNRSRC